MTIEIIASRIIAPYVGVSLYTWTSIIGVVLLGIALGNWLGGRYADTHNPRKTLGVAFFCASASVLFLILFTPVIWNSTLHSSTMSLPALVFLLTLITFLPISFFLSTVTPLAVKSQLHQIEKSGETVGLLYGISAAGSIFGTFLTGFWLVAFFGIQSILWAIFILLLIFGGFFWFQNSKNLTHTTVRIGVLLVLGFSISTVFAQEDICEYETQYYCVNILETGEGITESRELILDHLLHSKVFLYSEIDPFGVSYLRVLGLLSGYKHHPSASFKVLSIGGGGYVLPRYILNNYPNAEVTVIEIDPQITEISRERLGLVDNERLTILHGDARSIINNFNDEEKFDVIIGDAFNDFLVPFQLTTKEFYETLLDHMTEDGLYAFHFIDSYAEGRFLASNLLTVDGVFKHTYFFPMSTQWKTNSDRATYIVVGSQTLIDVEVWSSVEPVGEDYHWSLFTTEEKNDVRTHVPMKGMSTFIEARNGTVLKDNYAPVENMLATFFSL